MSRIIIVAVGALAISATTAAQAQTKIEKAPIQDTSPADGPGMFRTYCAVCHGADGKGNGPAAPALTKAPADLTRISTRNNGAYPTVKVRRYIEGVDTVEAHGTRDMPMWGDLFRSLNRDAAAIRVEVLVNYLKEMQK